jgi:hypothetical protein
METLNITTGEKRVAVIVDGVNGKELVFNPEDARFIEHLHHFYRVANQKAHEWNQNKAEMVQRIIDIPEDENGIPETIAPAVEPLREMNNFMREQIDAIFGAGTSKNIFGDTVFRNPAVYVQLIDGIRDYVNPVRAKKVGQYMPPAKKKSKPRKRTPAKKKK